MGSVAGEANIRMMRSIPPDSTMPIADAERRDEIMRLEEEIEALAETLERCRKISVASKVAIAGGTIALLGLAIGAVRLDLLVLICAITATIGGIVAYGSNVSTSRQTMADLKAGESRRAALIDGSDLRLVESAAHPGIGSNIGPVETTSR